MIQTINPPPTANAMEGIVERCEHGLVVLAPASGRFSRRVLYVNNYGGREVWEKVKAGLVPPHHFWGCLELARMGYEVALAEPVQDFDYRRRPVPHDLRLFTVVRSWLRPDDIVYCAHNVLFWIPFLRSLGLFRRHIVSLLFAREPLDFSGAHSAVIALTPTAACQAARLAPKAKIAHLGWGVDIRVFPRQPYNPEYLLHCGIAGRDFGTLHKAACKSKQPLRIIAAWPIDGFAWPDHVAVIDGGQAHNHQDKKVSFSDLLHKHYSGSAATLIVTTANPEMNHAFGFTNLIEALAMAKPIIHTRTGALAEEIDVEKEGCGFTVPPNDPVALAAAMDAITNDRDRAEAMGRAARKLCESHYNIQRYSTQLHELFNSL